MPFSDAAYDPDTLQLLMLAFNDACAEQTIGDAHHAPSRAGRTLMALRLMMATAGGERDPEQLRRAAVHAVEGQWSIEPTERREH